MNINRIKLNNLSPNDNNYSYIISLIIHIEIFGVLKHKKNYNLLKLHIDQMKIDNLTSNVLIDIVMLH